MRNAFTLIEVMVVLSILAIIAILGYNFFGSTMKEAKLTQAVTEIKRHFDAMEVAVERYRIKNGTDPGKNDTAFTNLVDGGFLRQKPMPPAWIQRDDIACSNEFNPSDKGYALTNEWSIGDSSTADPDYMMYTMCVTKEICDKWNDAFSGIKGWIPNGQTDIMTNGATQCYGNDSYTYSYTILMAVENN